MYGIVEEGSGALPDGGFAKYRVRWDGRIDDWYARKQCLEYVISDGPICREDLVPAVVVPASSAHFEGGELLLYAMARKGCTSLRQVHVLAMRGWDGVSRGHHDRIDQPQKGVLANQLQLDGGAALPGPAAMQGGERQRLVVPPGPHGGVL